MRGDVVRGLRGFRGESANASKCCVHRLKPPPYPSHLLHQLLMPDGSRPRAVTIDTTPREVWLHRRTRPEIEPDRPDDALHFALRFGQALDLGSDASCRIEHGRHRREIGVAAEQAEQV